MELSACIIIPWGRFRIVIIIVDVAEHIILIVSIAASIGFRESSTHFEYRTVKSILFENNHIIILLYCYSMLISYLFFYRIDFKLGTDFYVTIFILFIEVLTFRSLINLTVCRDSPILLTPLNMRDLSFRP